MPSHTCVVYGSTPTQDPDASFHCLPSNTARRASWLDAFGLEEIQLKAQSQERAHSDLEKEVFISRKEVR